MNNYTKSSILILSVLLSLASIDTSQSSEVSKAKITLNDLNQLKDISSIDVSHSANLVVYSVWSVDEKKDRYRNDIWLLDLNKNKEKILLKGNPSIGKTRFSPDDILLGYLAPGRGKYADYQQIWTINTKNLVKRQITRLKANINDFEWSPDGKKIVLVAEPNASEKDKKIMAITNVNSSEPIVIDRYHFKQDGNGFLGDERQHLYLLDIKSRTTKQLTKGSSNEFLPSWSPDNKRIAYVTKTGDITELIIMISMFLSLIQLKTLFSSPLPLEQILHPLDLNGALMVRKLLIFMVVTQHFYGMR